MKSFLNATQHHTNPQEQFCQDLIERLRSMFVPRGVTFKVDDGSQAIGKKYARSDEIGVPFNLTIDGDTKESGKVTLRERDTTRQVCLLFILIEGLL